MKQLVILRLKVLSRSGSGAVAITTALLLVLFLGLAAIAVDIGHLAIVKSELQRTVDAAALAGAMGLAPYTGSLSNPTPNWVQGQSKAREIIQNAANKADNHIFSETDGTVTYGYWLLRAPAGYVQPPLATTRPTTAVYVPEPAINVTLSRNVTLSFAPIVGVANPRQVTAKAIAILPEAYSVTNIPPIAVSTDTVYDNINGTIVMDISEQDIKIDSNKGTAGWFNLDGENSVPSVLYSDPLTSTTSQIFLVPGTKATLTGLISVGQTIVLPVVNNIEQKVWKTISGFAGFTIDNLGANDMTGHFVTKVFNPYVQMTPYNTSYSPVWGTPRLVN
jgi:hypothetical protein